MWCKLKLPPSVTAGSNCRINSVHIPLLYPLCRLSCGLQQHWASAGCSRPAQTGTLGPPGPSAAAPTQLLTDCGTLQVAWEVQQEYSVNSNATFRKIKPASLLQTTYRAESKCAQTGLAACFSYLLQHVQIWLLFFFLIVIIIIIIIHILMNCL